MKLWAGFLLAVALPAQTLQSIAVSPRNLTMAPGANISQQFILSGTFSDGSVQDVTALAAWTTSDSTIATVTATGLATQGNTAGYCLLTASLDGLSASASVEVTGQPVQQTLLGTLPVGNNPYGIAVNPATNRIYVTNQNDNTVTAINGATLRSQVIAVGSNPTAIAVNVATNHIYVADTGTVSNPGNSVTVIDGATNQTSTVTVGNAPNAIAVNPVTNKIYVANFNDATLTVIDGATGSTANVSFTVSGIGPDAVAVNPVTNQVWVALEATKTSPHQVALVDGATNNVTFVSLPNATAGFGEFIAVNPAANQILTGGLGMGIYSIDGNTNSATEVTGVNNFSGEANTAVADPDSESFLTDDTLGTPAFLDFQESPFRYHTLTQLLPAVSKAASVALNPFTNQFYVAAYVDTSGWLTVIDGASFETAGSGPVTPNLTTYPIMGTPVAVGVNSLTGRIFVVDQQNNDVLMFDGSTYVPSLGLPAEGAVSDAAVNPVTHKVYLTDHSVVQVLDLATQALSPIAAGSNPVAVDVNALTNQIYVANEGSNNVTVIDGASGTVTNTIPAGSAPAAIRVNPVTGRIYVLNTNGFTGAASVTVIDGATGATTSVPAGVLTSPSFTTVPHLMALDPVADKVYVVCTGSNSITVIDGANRAVSVPDSRGPVSVAVNPVTNIAYVGDSSGMVAIDGLTYAATELNFPGNLTTAVDPVHNLIFASNVNGLSVIDGATNSVTPVILSHLAGIPSAVEADPVAGKLYIAMTAGEGLLVMDEASGGIFSSNGDNPVGSNPIAPKASVLAVDSAAGQLVVPSGSAASLQTVTISAVRPLPLNVAIAPLPGNRTGSLTPTFTLTPSDTLAPQPTAVQAVYYQIDQTGGAWSSATANGDGTYSAIAPPLLPGMHTLFAYPTDGQDSTSVSTAPLNAGLSSPFTGNVASYVFFVVPAAALCVAETHAASFQQGQTGVYTITVSNAATASAATSGEVTVTDTLPAGLSLVSIGGMGWVCPAGGAQCMRSDPLAPGGSYDAITVTVNVSPGAPNSVTNQVTATGGDSAPAGYSDTTPVSPANPCDLQHTGGATVGDVQLLINQALGEAPAVNDLNGDGAINVVDLQIEINSALGGTCQGS